MSQVTLSVRVDETVKRKFDNFCSEVGMNTSVAINLFMKAVLREKRIPFEIAVPSDPFFNPVNQAILHQSIRQLEAGQGTRHELIEDSGEDA